MVRFKFIAVGLVCLFLLVGFFSSPKSKKGEEEYTAYTPPSVEPGEDGWEIYKEAPLYDRDSAKGVRPGNSSPEAAVVHFYTSMIRGDDAYQEVIPDPSLQSRRLKRKLEKISEWKFLKFKLVSRKKQSDTMYWIKIFFQISFEEGEVDEGEDEATVRLKDGKWCVTSVPT